MASTPRHNHSDKARSRKPSSCKLIRPGSGSRAGVHGDRGGGADQLGDTHADPVADVFDDNVDHGTPAVATSVTEALFSAIVAARYPQSSSLT